MNKYYELKYRLSVVLFLLLLVGCSSGDNKVVSQKNIENTETTFIPTTTEVVYPDEYAVPENIDVEYVEMIVRRLEQVRNDSYLSEIANWEYNPAVENRIKAIGKNRYVLEELEDLSEFVYMQNRDEYRVDHENIYSNISVKKIIKSTDSCIWYTGHVNDWIYGGVNIKNYTPLVRDDIHDKSINPTPWVYGDLNGTECTP